MESQLESYTNTEISGGGSSNSESHVLELKLKALILDTIHSIDVVQQLIKHGIKSLDEWMWQKQLRYYMKKRNSCDLFCCFSYTMLHTDLHTVKKYNGILQWLCYMNNGLQLARKYARIFVEGHLCSKKRAVFRERSSRKTVSFEQHIMSKDKYSSNFSCQMEVIVFIVLQMFFTTCAVLNIEEYHSDIPQC